MGKKYCAVPMCGNSNKKTPEKLFFSIPQNVKLRKKWTKAMKRAEPISNTSHLHVCEDHFDIENDMENYIRYKLMGGMLKLKASVVPHKFACQKPQVEVKERPAVEKRRKIAILNKILNEDYQSLENNVEEIFIVQSTPQQIGEPDPDPLESNEINDEDKPKQKCDKKVQACIKNKTYHKSTMTIEKYLKKEDDYTLNRKRKCGANGRFKSTSISTSTTFKDSLCRLDAHGENSEDSDYETINFKSHMQKAALLTISRDPQLLLGLPKQCYFTINLLSEYGKCSHKDVMITLKKIRLNQCNALLALDFGLKGNSIEKIFKKTIPALAFCMKTLIIYPDSQDVLVNLPMAFRKQYSNIQSIIEYLEVQIETPADSVQQALTWSKCKGCNTIKYLISITPDGLINYISEGYGGGTCNSLIIEDCGLLDLPRNAAVLTDRGFENVSDLLLQKECVLRPPSDKSKITPTRNEMLEPRKIAALHVHVERSIGRLRDFGFLMPHACIDYKQVDLLDFVTIIACGIVNLQSHLLDVS